MATWEKIEDHMPNGGTAIQAALEEINAELETTTEVTTIRITDVAKLHADMSGKLSKVNVTLTRVGQMVFFTGSIRIQQATNLQYKTLLTIPDGYKPSTASPYFTGNAGAFEQNGESTNGALLGNGSIITLLVNNPGTARYVGFDMFWTTDDDIATA